jgi:glucan phosphoethanolaminetransferase (alkaline phosphatase superfamily)
MNRLRNFLMRKIDVNIAYFGFLFVFLSFVHVYHLYLIQTSDALFRFAFVVEALLQCFLETTLLVLLWNLIKGVVPRFFHLLFIQLTFLLFLAHIIDFFLIRIMGMTVWFGLGFLSLESFDNFIEMLIASNVPLSTWLMGAVITLCLLLSGVLFFFFVEKWVRRRSFSVRSFGIIACGALFSLVLWDGAAAYFFSNTQYGEHKDVLPWKATLFSPAKEIFTFTSSLKPIEEEAHALRMSEKGALIAKHKPNIYLFIIESLREDFITREVAPNLSLFRDENIAFDYAFSNANATQNAWFSLFYSKYPFYWSLPQKKKWKTGSMPLNILKKMGYQINVYSSARLSYYNMGEVIFGKKEHLADQLYVFPHDTTPAYLSDQKTMAQMCKDMQNPAQKEGNLFIVFLESTHFDYSWPREAGDRFAPLVDEIAYLKVACSTEDVEKIKNRYRNAIYFVDSLFGQFTTLLKGMKSQKDAFVMVTADHGEEFYEHGHIFHASDLCTAQTHVPLYYKMGEKRPALKQTKLTSHIDIFPTLFHYLAGEEVFTDLLEGESIFKEKRLSFTVSGRYNGTRAPFEFFICDGAYKLTARFSNEGDIFSSKEINILSTKDVHDNPVHTTPQLVEKHFGEALNFFFAR